ncbi:hypothetical protein [Enterobacter kobei]|uniref:hypothetical protein n=1 Tax=Enterobacter kobei TaxID=208224 RepID=UPI0018C29CDC|nr:hypothetical protein [Enterobacter kobei]MBG0587301.1 hypothetical protein [Enterobacter kobei]MEB2457898.1 hypothetical protein [Enterobacter kobei]
MKDNNTFCGSKITRFNATVGTNGSLEVGNKPRSNIFYAEGFETAALEMINIALASQKFEHSVDTLVYPICFNMRHSVELRLKKLWMDLEILSKFTFEKLQAHRLNKIDKNPALDRTKVLTFPNIKALQYHDISAIWTSISEYSPIIDNRFTPLINLISDFIQDIAEIDPTGQTFRYPADNDSKTHLLDTPLISINILQVRFQNLKNALELLNELAERMIHEYSLCREYSVTAHKYKENTRVSHTHKLSYSDIINIVYSMSKYINEAEPCHIAAKNDIKLKFNLSNKDYGKAVSIIHNDPLVNNLLNHPNHLEFLTEKDLYELFNILNAHTPLSELYATNSDLGTLIDWSAQGLQAIFDTTVTQRENDALDNLLATFDNNKLAEIVALYLLQKDYLYYAVYLRLLKENILELESFNGDIDKTKEYINHYLEKTNLAQYIIYSLYLFNFKELTHGVVTTYGFAEAQWYTNLTNGRYKSAYSEHAIYLRDISLLKNKTSQSNAIVAKLKHK